LEKQLESNGYCQLRTVDSSDQAAPALKSVTLSGSLCYENAHEVVEAVQLLLSRRPEKLVLEMGEVQMIDSSGLRALLSGHKLCEEAGASLRIGATSDCVARIIAMSGLEETFGVPKMIRGSRKVEPLLETDFESAEWKVSEHVVTSDASVIAVLREKVADAAASAGADAETLCDIRIAVGEALTNAYRHGSPTQGVSKITVRCLTCTRALVVEIRDEGEPFDAGAVSEPDPKQMRDHGMGLYLMRQAMDVVEFHNGGPGNRVRMVKWLKPRD
jgi:serine/threonine-protein kinase RsbW